MKTASDVRYAADSGGTVALLISVGGAAAGTKRGPAFYFQVVTNPPGKIVPCVIRGRINCTPARK